VVVGIMSAPVQGTVGPGKNFREPYENGGAEQKGAGKSQQELGRRRKRFESPLHQGGTAPNAQRKQKGNPFQSQCVHGFGIGN
jgi:hypothetical protein